MDNSINLNKQVFDKGKYSKIIDTEFKQLISVSSLPTSSLITIPEFFDAYNKLFFEIPQQGEKDSHEYLVKTSGDYININQSDEEIQALIEEVTQLRQDNIDLNQQILNLSKPK